MSDYPKCVNCNRETHPYFIKKYGGYCLDCANAGAGDKDDEIADLRAENERLRAALEPFAAEGRRLAMFLAPERDEVPLPNHDGLNSGHFRRAVAALAPETPPRCPKTPGGERCGLPAGHTGKCCWVNGD